ncbi:hypothetical protein IFM89_015140, partial [Coptis chinensis]
WRMSSMHISVLTLRLPYAIIPFHLLWQFFLGDYRPFIQDTHGNVLDQEMLHRPLGVKGKMHQTEAEVPFSKMRGLNHIILARLFSMELKTSILINQLLGHLYQLKLTRKDGENDDPYGSASRGNWRQGSLYY